MFVKIPSYDNGVDGQLDFKKATDFYININTIVGVEEQYNDITHSNETFFWTVDGGEYYCPLCLDELLKLINK